MWVEPAAINAQVTWHDDTVSTIRISYWKWQELRLQGKIKKAVFLYDDD